MDDKELVRSRLERNAEAMDEASRGKGRYFVDPKAAGEIAEDLREYRKALDRNAVNLRQILDAMFYASLPPAGGKTGYVYWPAIVEPVERPDK